MLVLTTMKQFRIKTFREDKQAYHSHDVFFPLGATIADVSRILLDQYREEAKTRKSANGDDPTSQIVLVEIVGESPVYLPDTAAGILGQVSESLMDKSIGHLTE